MSSFHAHTLPTYLSAYLAMYQFDRHFFGDYCVQGFVGK